MNNVTSSDGAVAVVSSTLGTVTWTFATSTPLAVSAGGNLTLQLWAQTNLIPAISQTAESLSASIQNTTDFQYYDGADSNAYTTGLINLPAPQVPITVSNLSWGQGQ